MDKRFYKEYRNYSACKSISKIRLIYQICFYLGLIGALFIFLKLNAINAEFILYFTIALAYMFAYAVLIVLRVVEHLVERVFYLEKELVSRGVIPPKETQEPPQNNN